MASLRPHLLLLPLLSTFPRLRLRPRLHLHLKPPLPTLPPPRRFLSSAPHAPLALRHDLESNTSDTELELAFEDVDVDSDDDVVSASAAEEDTADDVDVDAVPLVKLESPELSVKEKKELASYAHSLGKKLKSQQVGKSGVTAAVAAAFAETLESKELLKLKVHGSCPGELSEVIKQLEEATGSVAVGQIGRSVILYKPSLSKMKKKEAQSTRKVWRPKSAESSPTFGVEKKWKSSPTFGAAKKWKGKLTESSPTFGAGKLKVRRGEQYQSRHA